jgi:DMSO reductase anchor subunit
VIVLPALLGVVLLWWALAWANGSNGAATEGAVSPATAWLLHIALPLLALLACAGLWLCTAQIYACLRFIQEWAHPLTLVNYVLVGLAGGLMLGCALAATLGDRAMLAEFGPRALAATLAAWATRTAALRRNAALKPVSTAQSATGLRAERVVQKSMGMTGGAFNTREFFHGASQAAIRHIRLALHALGFGLPALMLAVGLALGAGSVGALWWWLALAVHMPGLMAERWLFFAQARHPQNLYYQAVS